MPPIFTMLIEAFDSPERMMSILAFPILAALTFIFLPRFPRLKDRVRRILRWRWTARLSLLGALATALGFAINGMWVGDDAFISFRYAENLAHGQGLVYNIGERVEGYTNFLWTVIIAGAIRLDLPAPETAVALNLLFMTGTLLIVHATVRRMDPLRGPAKTALPITPWLLALTYPFTSFGSSGLETSMAAFFVCLGLYAWISRPDTPGAFCSGLCLIFSTLSRPDHALFYISMASIIAAPIFSRRRNEGYAGVKQLAAFSLPFLLVYLPYFLWRYTYYGHFFPNTYYAKMADQTYFIQGFTYLETFIWGEGYWLLIPFFIALLFTREKGRSLSHLTRFCSLSILLLTLYIIKVGGDFMQARFFVPLIPLFFLVIELNGKQWLLNKLPATKPQPVKMTAGRLRFVISVCLMVFALALACFHPRVIKPRTIFNHIADEATYYPVTDYHPMVIESPYFRRAQALALAFARMEKKPLYATFSIGMEAFYSKLPILDCFGLTDSQIAHQPFHGRRGRPGHERRADAAYMAKRRPEIFLRKSMPLPFEEYRDLQFLDINGYTVYMSRYPPDLLARLEANTRLRLKYLHFPEYLERYLTEEMPDQEASQVDRDLEFFNAYYFDHVENPILSTRLIEALDEKRGISQLTGEAQLAHKD